MAYNAVTQMSGVLFSQVHFPLTASDVETYCHVIAILCDKITSLERIIKDFREVGTEPLSREDWGAYTQMLQCHRGFKNHRKKLRELLKTASPAAATEGLRRAGVLMARTQANHRNQATEGDAAAESGGVEADTEDAQDEGLKEAGESTGEI